MNLKGWLSLATLTTLEVTASGLFSIASAIGFANAEVNQNRFILMATAGGSRLTILEQITDERPCWRTNGNEVDPLLLTFDFTGICGRGTDRNGYSVRVGGQDLGLQYSLRTETIGNRMVLYAVPSDRSQVPLEVGRTNGLPNQFGQIYLNPGWRLTRRVYDGRNLGHLYLTNDQSLPTLIAANSPYTGYPTPPTPTRPTPRPPQPPVIDVSDRNWGSLPTGTQISVYSDSERVIVTPDETKSQTLTIAESVRDSWGSIIIPAGSTVTGTLQPINGGTQFRARTIQLRGSSTPVPINALSRVVTTRETITRRSNPDILRGAAIGGAAAAILAEVTGKIDLLEVLAGAGLGILGEISLRQERSVEVLVVNPAADLTLTLQSEFRSDTTLNTLTDSPVQPTVSDRPNDGFNRRTGNLGRDRLLETWLRERRR